MKKKFVINLISVLIISVLLLMFLPNKFAVQAGYPGVRCYHNMTYDSENDVVIMYGGASGTAGVDDWQYRTWMYDYNTNNWTNMKPSQSPNTSLLHNMAYDSESDLTITYGGAYGDAVFFNQTWAYDYSSNNWEILTTNQGPWIRSWHNMVYDSESDIIVLQGGVIGVEASPTGEKLHYNDTWVFDYNTLTWTNMTPAFSAPGIESSCMAYDSESDRAIVFGGDDEPTAGLTGVSNEWWAYDYNSNQWENLTHANGPAARQFHQMEYDSESDVVILHGGTPNNNPHAISDETWAYDYNTNNWTQMANGPVRGKHSMAYDSESDKILIYGGFNEVSGVKYTGDVWSYNYNNDTWKLLPLPELPDPDPTPTDENSLSLIIILSGILSTVCIRRIRKE